MQIRTRKDLFSGLEKSANFLQIVVWSIVSLFLVIAVAAIVISFSLSTRERRREYALLRIVGYARKRLRTLVLGESLLVSAVLFGALWALVLEWLPQRWPDVFAPDPQPWLDSYILMATLLAQFLSARKCWECWIVWLVVNCANIVLYISSGLYVMPIVSALYLANGIWSLISWKRKFRRNE